MRHAICFALLMTDAARFPSDITKLGRGKCQRAILDYLHRTERGTSSVVITDMAAHQAFRRMHFGSVISAVDALVKRGIVREGNDDIGRPTIRLVQHTHN